MRRPGESVPAATPTPAHTVVRASLLVADVALTGGAALYFFNRTAAEGGTTAVALLAVALGGWLGWLGLTWGRDPRA